MTVALLPTALMFLSSAPALELIRGPACLITFAGLASIGMACRSVWKFPISVDPAALDGYDILGFPVAVGWEGFREIRPAWLFGLRYLRISSLTHQSVLWMPLHVKDFHGLAEAVATYAGEDHPLTQELYQRLRDE